MSNDTNAGPVLPPLPARDGISLASLAPWWLAHSVEGYAKQVAEPLRERVAQLEVDAEYYCSEADKLRQRIAELEREIKSHRVRAQQDAESWQIALSELDARGAELDRLQSELNRERAENEALKKALVDHWRAAVTLQNSVVETNGVAGMDGMSAANDAARDLLRAIDAARAAREGETK